MGVDDFDTNPCAYSQSITFTLSDTKFRLLSKLDSDLAEAISYSLIEREL